MYVSPPNTDPCIEQMLNAYHILNNSVTSVTTTVESELNVNGILKIQESSISSKHPTMFKIESTQEKPSSQLAEEKKLFLSKELLSALQLPEQKERQCLCYFGIDILTTDIFKFIEKCWIELQEVNKNREKKEELNLRIHGMKQIIESPEHGMHAVIINGKRCDTGLPVPYLESMNTIFYSNR
jgi:UTP-glucose-1-phosphate uridylyltransferase